MGVIHTVKNNREPQCAARYIRVSTDDQAEYSPAAQNRALVRYALANGLVVDDRYLYIDEGISGRKAEKRPAFMRMIAQAKANNPPFDVILVHKFDRFARSREDSVVYKSLLRKECGIRIVSITESIEDDKFSIILEAMLEAMAEYYSINLSEEVKKGMSEKALRGGLQSIAPFGYSVRGNVLVPLMPEAELIREVFRRFNDGHGYFSISKWLNETGVRTKRGNRFENRTVEYIIRNPVYIGKLRWNPAGKTRRDYDNENIILAQGKHEPLIAQETWDAAQRRAREVKARWKCHSRPPEEKADWISGLIRCAACGNTMVFSKPCYWRCNGYAKGACGHSQHVRDDLIKEAIIARLQKDAQTDLPIAYTISPSAAHPVDERTLLKQKKERLENRAGRLREAFLSGADTVKEYKAAKESLQDEIKALHQKIAALENSNPEDVSAKEIKGAVDDALRALLAADVSIRQKHAAADSIIDRCVWDKSKNLLNVHYRCVF